MHRSTLWLLAALALAACGATSGHDRARPSPARGLARLLGNGRLLFSRGGDLWILVEPAGSVERLTATPGWSERAGSWSPDGRSIAYVRTAAAKPGQPTTTTPEVWVMELATRAARRVSAGDGGDYPAWSPDGSRIAYGSPRGLTVVTPDGRERRRLGVHGSCPVWSPDGRSLAYCAAVSLSSTASTVRVVDADGQHDRPLSARSLTDAVVGAWSPDGRWLAYAGKRAGGDFDVFRADLSSGASRLVMQRRGTQTVQASSARGALLVADWPSDETPRPRWLVVAPDGHASTAALPRGTEDAVAWQPQGARRAAPPPPSAATSPATANRIDVGGRALWLDCAGAGAPTVLLEAPLGADSTTWTRVQALLTPRHRTCRYDRAGLGASDDATGPRDAAVAVHDLYRLVHRAALATPLVLVGASYGGLIAQLYAAEHPADVAGLVLVDAVHPALDARIERLLGPHGAAERRRQLEQNLEHITYPDLVRTDAEVDQAPPLRGRPVAVLRHGLPFAGGPGFPSSAVERLWTALQRSLADEGRPGRIWVARRSHHRIAESQPDIVGVAVSWVVRHGR